MLHEVMIAFLIFKDLQIKRYTKDSLIFIDGAILISNLFYFLFRTANTFVQQLTHNFLKLSTIVQIYVCFFRKFLKAFQSSEKVSHASKEFAVCIIDIIMVKHLVVNYVVKYGDFHKIWLFVYRFLVCIGKYIRVWISSEINLKIRHLFIYSLLTKYSSQMKNIVLFKKKSFFLIVQR